LNFEEKIEANTRKKIEDDFKSQENKEKGLKKNILANFN